MIPFRPIIFIHQFFNITFQYEFVGFQLAIFFRNQNIIQGAGA